MLKSQQLGGGIPLRMPFSPERNFNYARPIRIRNPTINLYNYILTINLTKDNFSFKDAKIDGTDIRFKNANRKLLQYYIQSWDYASETGQIKILMPILEERKEIIIWMFYGNDIGINTCTPSDTINYRLLENFNYPWTGSPLPPGTHTDWDAVWGNFQGAGITTISDPGKLRWYSSSGNQSASWDLKRTFPYSFEVEFDLATNGYLYGNYFEIQLSGDNTKFRFYQGDGTPRHLYLYRSDGSSTSVNAPWGGWRTFKILFDNTNYTLHSNDVELIKTTNTTSSTFKTLTFQGHIQHQGIYIAIDNLKMTNYFPIEPTYEFV